MPGFLAGTAVWIELSYPDCSAPRQRRVPVGGHFAEVYVIRPLWTEPAVTAITSTWTEPAVTPTVEEDD